MSAGRPSLVVLVGPNGAGKSTAAPYLLRDTLGVQEFVNADEIARGLSGFRPESAALAAGRIMVTHLKQLAARRATFGFETTLASKTFAPWISELRQSGYEFRLVFLWLSSVEIARGRVQERVRQGGHDIPEETIRRRYRAGLRNFFGIYQPLTTAWRVYDNSGSEGPQLIAKGQGTAVVETAKADAWAKFRKDSLGENES